MIGFNKEKIISLVLAQLEKIKLELAESTENFRQSASQSSKSTESWSDSSRTQFNMMAGAVQNEVLSIASTIKFLKTVGEKIFNIAEAGSLVEARENSRSKFYFLVPEGSGGFIVRLQGEEILVMSVASPLGSVLAGKKAGDRVVFSAEGESVPGGNNKNFEIVEVS